MEGGNWPDQLTRALETPDNGAWRVVRVAVGGQSFQTSLLANAPTNVDKEYTNSSVRNVVSIFAGTNDIIQGRSAAQIYADYQTYGTARKAAGFTVIAFTSMSAENRSEAVRTTLNNSLKTDFSVSTAYSGIYLPGPGVTWADVLVDVGSDAHLGCNLCWQAGDAATYYTDNVHLTVAGYTIVKNYVYNALRALSFIP